MTLYKEKSPPAEMRQLANGVYAFLQPADIFCSNSGLIVCDEYAIVIDSQTNRYMVENFIRKIREVTDKPVRFLFNTHWHTDHIYTNYYFTGANVITSSTNRKMTLRLDPIELEFFSKVRPEPWWFDGAKVVPQNIVFDGTLTIYSGEREIRFIDLGPAHSESDCIVYLPKEKIIFTGDLVVWNFPKTKPGVTALTHGSYRMIEVLSALANMDAEFYVPGHGNTVLTREQVVQYASEVIEFLLVMREEARRCFNKGLTYKQAVEEIDYNKLKKWGDKQSLYMVVFANCARAWSEFIGEPPGSLIDVEEIYAKMIPNLDGTYPERIDLGWTKPSGKKW